MDFVRRPPFLIKFCHDRLSASPHWPAAGLRFVPNAPGASRLDSRNRTQKMSGKRVASLMPLVARFSDFDRGKFFGCFLS